MLISLPAVLFFLGAIGALVWLVLHLGGAYALQRVRSVSVDGPGPMPTLSVVVAACDEADTVGAGLSSLLAQDYPSLEVIIVNDRSTDATRAIADGIAAGDARVRVLHVDRLPPGWLGKVNALRVGTAAAGGEFLLFADADVHYGCGALRAALSTAASNGIDHLTLLPRLRGVSLWHRALMAAFFTGYVRRSVLSRRPFGYGAFNLVRRAAFERTDGFEWLRMEVVDDIALGAMMQAAGYRSECRVATDMLEIMWYPSARAALRGFEKNVFGAVARYRVDLLVVTVAGSVWLASAPFLTLLTPYAPWAWLPPALALAALATQAAVARRRFAIPIPATLLEPATHLLVAWALLRGGFKCLRNGGIVWRGTHYPIDGLRAGRRVSFP